MTRRTATKKLRKGQEPPMVQLDLSADDVPAKKSVMDLLIEAQGGVWNMHTRTLEQADGQLEDAARDAAKADAHAADAQTETAAEEPARRTRTGKSYDKDPERYWYERGYHQGKSGKDFDLEVDLAAHPRYKAGYDKGREKRTPTENAE